MKVRDDSEEAIRLTCISLTVDAKLYILMDLIDGAPLKEHINSVREKKQNFSESRIWNVLIQVWPHLILPEHHLRMSLRFQMIMALRYLHKEKSIVHRDLNPNNVMLADNDHVIISKCTFWPARARCARVLFQPTLG